jgi:hypothetical protein
MRDMWGGVFLRTQAARLAVRDVGSRRPLPVVAACSRLAPRRVVRARGDRTRRADVHAVLDQHRLLVIAASGFFGALPADVLV